MRKLAAVLLLGVCYFPCLYGQKTRIGQPPPKAMPGVDYPLRVHISGIHVRTPCRGEVCRDVVYVDAVLNGKKIELMGDWIWFPGYYELAISPGDYQARLLKDSPKKNAAPIFQEYELVLPERTVWRCTVTGISE
ncbi:MAG: hypothetical protein WCF30_04840 [Terracidiphilus sp.]